MCCYREERQARKLDREGRCVPADEPHAPQFFWPVGSASGLKINFHREGVLSSWAFSVPAKTFSSQAAAEPVTFSVLSLGAASAGCDLLWRLWLRDVLCSGLPTQAFGNSFQYFAQFSASTVSLLL